MAELAELEAPRFAAIVDRQLADAADPGPVPPSAVQLPDDSWLLGETDFTWYSLSGHARFLEFPDSITIELSFKNPGSQWLWWREISNHSTRRPESYSYAGSMTEAGAMVGGGVHGGRAPTETTRDQRQSWEFPPGASVKILVSAKLWGAPLQTGSAPGCTALHFILGLDPPETKAPVSSKVPHKVLTLDWESGHAATVRPGWNLWPMR